MSKDPAFLFYPGDYLRDTQTLSANAQVAYDRIMCEHMRNICISKTQLNFFTKRLTDDERQELMFCLTENGHGFSIDWVAESINKRRAYSESRRKNREGKPKKNGKKICETYVKHMENENEIENVIGYLNEYAGKNFKKTDSTSRMINARLNEGFTVDEIKSVIRLKTDQWKNDPKMKAYIRPETLFNATKFQSYINETPTIEEKSYEGLTTEQIIQRLKQEAERKNN